MVLPVSLTDGCRGWSLAALLTFGASVLVTSTSAAAPASDTANWVGSWAAAVTGGEPTGSTHNGMNNQSYRMIVHASVGGSMLRVRLSNIYGEGTVTVGHATVAKPDTSTPALSDIDPGTVHELTFNGKPSTTMLKGDELLSDPVDMPVADLSDLVVTLYFPTPTGPTTFHAISQQSAFQGAGDLASAAAGTGFTVQRDCCWFFLSGVDVLRAAVPGTVVVLGDSISDGNGSTLNANKRWPDLLAAQLVGPGRAGVPGVLNLSLAGNRLNHEGPEPGAGGFPGFVQLGPNAGARLNEDVFEQTGVQTVILQLGIDDIWMNGDSADAIIDTIRKIATQIRARHLRILVTTITPYQGFELFLSGAWTPDKEATRNAVNAYLRGSTEFDGLIDFDALLRDPANPSKLRPDIDSGDHFHPNDLGAQQMADSIRPQLLR